MSTSPNRRYLRAQKKLYEKINKQFLERIKGKSPSEVAVILEQIRIKYGLPTLEEQAEIINPIEIDGTEF